jgi:hypothetical protein
MSTLDHLSSTGNTVPSRNIGNASPQKPTATKTNACALKCLRYLACILLITSIVGIPFLCAYLYYTRSGTREPERTAIITSSLPPVVEGAPPMEKVRGISSLTDPPAVFAPLRAEETPSSLEKGGSKDDSVAPAGDALGYSRLPVGRKFSCQGEITKYLELKYELFDDEESPGLKVEDRSPDGRGSFGYIQYKHKAKGQTSSTARKVHISVERSSENFSKAVGLIIEMIDRYEPAYFKMISEKERAEGTREPSGNNSLGKEFVIYESKPNLVMLTELEAVLRSNGIRRGNPSLGDIPITGSDYLFTRSPKNFLNQYIPARTLDLCGFTSGEAARIGQTEYFDVNLSPSSSHSSGDIAHGSLRPVDETEVPLFRGVPFLHKELNFKFLNSLVYGFF